MDDDCCFLFLSYEVRRVEDMRTAIVYDWELSEVDNKGTLPTGIALGLGAATLGDGSTYTNLALNRWWSSRDAVSPAKASVLWYWSKPWSTSPSKHAHVEILVSVIDSVLTGLSEICTVWQT